MWQPRRFEGAKTIDSSGKATTLEFNRYEPLDAVQGAKGGIAEGESLPPYFGTIVKSTKAPGAYQILEGMTGDLSLVNAAWKRAEAEWATF